MAAQTPSPRRKGASVRKIPTTRERTMTPILTPGHPKVKGQIGQQAENLPDADRGIPPPHVNRGMPPPNVTKGSTRKPDVKEETEMTARVILTLLALNRISSRNS